MWEHYYFAPLICEQPLVRVCMQVDSRRRPRLLDCRERRSSVEWWIPKAELVLRLRLDWGLRSDQVTAAEGEGEKQVSTEEEFLCFYLKREVLIGLNDSRGVWLEGSGDTVLVVDLFFFPCLGDNLLEAVLEDFPMSASERWIGFFVWWRCFLSSTKLIFSFKSGGMRPSAICRSTMSSGGGLDYGHINGTKFMLKMDMNSARNS